MQVLFSSRSTTNTNRILQEFRLWKYVTCFRRSSCIAFFVCGLILLVTGIRQSLRRLTRMQHHLPESIKRSENGLSVVE